MQKVEVEAILKAAKRIAILQQMGIERGLELREHKIAEIIEQELGRIPIPTAKQFHPHNCNSF